MILQKAKRGTIDDALALLRKVCNMNKTQLRDTGRGDVDTLIRSAFTNLLHREVGIDISEIATIVGRSYDGVRSRFAKHEDRMEHKDYRDTYVALRHSNTHLMHDKWRTRD